MATILAADKSKPIKITTKKVKLIAKIRGDKKLEEKASSISVNNNFVTFKDHSNRDGYEVDSCYGRNEDNFAIYSREIKPLLPSVYDGQSLTVIGFGAKGSGKTFTIQGNEKEQGLAALATNEILSGANENGISVSISLFEVFNEHIYDLLDPKHSEIQVLEDAKGKIKLKGISEAILESISEFHKLYSLGYSTNRRSHRGLIIKISSKSGTSSSKTVSKMTFVDLAGYEDARRKSCEGVDLIENSRINKSIYSLLNVVHAINASEPRVPFRESKLTRMLQESFGSQNRVLLINCLNPFSCQDTVFTLQLASRSCQGVNRMSVNSIQKSKFSGKSTVSSALKGKLNVGSSAKKQASSTPSISVRNKSRIAKERKVEDKGKDAVALNQLKSPSVRTMQSRYISEIKSEISLSIPEEEELMSKDCVVTIAKDEVAHFLQKDSMSKSCVVTTAKDKVAHVLQEDSMSKNCVVTTAKDEVAHFLQEGSMSKNCVVTTAKDEDTFVFNAFEDTKPKEEMVAEHQKIESHNLEVTPNVDGNTKSLILFGQGANKEKENNSLCVNGEGSPPLSSRLRELSNNLRNLYNSTPIQIKQKPEFDSSCGGKLALTNILDPKTPVQDKMDVERFNSPWEQYNNRSTGLKQSLADEYLKFINSASKEELKSLRGIGEKRATYILQLREESPEPFKSLEDLKDIGLSEKQVKGMMKKVAGDLFS